MNVKNVKNTESNNIYPVVAGWLHCRHCNTKLLRIRPDTRAENLEVYCKRCKKSHLLSIT